MIVNALVAAAGHVMTVNVVVHRNQVAVKLAVQVIFVANPVTGIVVANTPQNIAPKIRMPIRTFVMAILMGAPTKISLLMNMVNVQGNFNVHEAA